MVLYESHSVIHGRPFPLVGNYYANVFVHFEPVAPLDPDDPDTYDPERDIPPYLIPDSDWEIEWMRGNPQGWQGVSNNERSQREEGEHVLVDCANGVHRLFEKKMNTKTIESDGPTPGCNPRRY